MIALLKVLQLSIVPTSFQGRNHVFKVGGPVSWSRLLYHPSTEKIDRSTQFGAVCHIITLFIKKLPENLGVRPNFGGSEPSTLLPVVVPMLHSLTKTFYTACPTLTHTDKFLIVY